MLRISFSIFRFWHYIFFCELIENDIEKFNLWYMYTQKSMSGMNSFMWVFFSDNETDSGLLSLPFHMMGWPRIFEVDVQGYMGRERGSGQVSILRWPAEFIVQWSDWNRGTIRKCKLSRKTDWTRCIILFQGYPHT